MWSDMHTCTDLVKVCAVCVTSKQVRSRSRRTGNKKVGNGMNSTTETCEFSIISSHCTFVIFPVKRAFIARNQYGDSRGNTHTNRSLNKLFARSGKKIECISFVLRNRPKLAMDFTSFRTAGFAKQLQLMERENRFSEPTLST